MTRIVLATVAGGLTSFVLGFLVYGLALSSFFAANVGSATGVYKATPDLAPVLLGQLALAFLLTLAINRWGNSTSLAGGAKVGALFGLLVALGFDLTMYGTTNIQNMTATLVDPIVSMALVGVTGAMIGMVLGRRQA
jgi:hypothetical protein